MLLAYTGAIFPRQDMALDMSINIMHLIKLDIILIYTEVIIIIACINT